LRAGSPSTHEAPRSAAAPAGAAAVLSIDLSRVYFAHSSAVPLISDLSLRLEAGWTGVVGPNGSGKTSLLALLAGEYVPDAGVLRLHPRGLSVRLCSQTVETLGDDVRAFAVAQGGGAERLRGELALEPAALARWESLSPGERKRWQVGAALHAEPGALLLDEPTNHLDGEAREHLLAALQGFRGIGLLVSHDRTLLDALTERTLRFHEGGIRLWRGGYGVARESWEREERERLDAYRELQAEKRKLRRRLADARQERAEAEAKRRRTMRRASIADIDTRKRFSMTRRRSAEARWGREIHKLRSAEARTDERAAAFTLHKQLGRSLGVDFEPAPVACLAELSGELRVGGSTLLRDLHLELSRTSRIHLAGPNGAGKSTLLAALLARARVPAARLLHLPQELSGADGPHLVAELRAAAPEAEGRVLAILAALGVSPAALLASGRPSPGEARKLAIAGGLARSVFAVVLDEPTNHLDPPSRAPPAAPLDEFPGALLLATHDDRFAERLTDTVWEIRDGRVVVRARAV
jgi:ATPase subunit of ABC transporter with duplicated ATPase domains